MSNISDKPSEAGKGDAYRKVDPKKWEEGWERIFGKKKGKKNQKKKTGKNN